MAKKTLCILLIISFCLSLISCSLPGELSKTEKVKSTPIAKSNHDDIMDMGPVKGGNLKLFSTTPDTLNPILTKNVHVKDFLGLIYEGLVRVDKNQNPVATLSDKWEVSSDGLTWTFHIRDKIFWHDNIPLTSEDVEFTLGTIINANVNTIYKKNVENIATFAAVGRDTFKIVLNRPNSFTPLLMTFPILPKHYFATEDLMTSKKNMAPVGTGPFIFSRYIENNMVILKCNEKWWNGKDEEQGTQVYPYIAQVDIKIYKSTKDAVNAFQAGDVDIINLETGGWDKYSGRTDVTLKKYTSRNYEFLSMNIANPVLSDKAVRQAIALTINKSKLSDDLLPGEAVVSDLPVMPDTWLYDTNTVAYTTDQLKARELLIQNGCTPVEYTGKDLDMPYEVMYKRINGVSKPITLELLVNQDNELRCKAAEKIKEQLKDIGIIVKIEKKSWDDEFKKINTKKYDMALMGCRISPTPDISFMYSLNGQNSGFNISGYNNPDVNRYLDQIIVENDNSRKKAFFINMKTIIDDETPFIGLYFYKNAVLCSKRVRGQLSPSAWDKYDSIAKCYIPVSK